jgi:toxin FitB
VPLSVGELHDGVTAAADPLVHLGRRRRVGAALSTFDVLPFDTATAEYYGALATLVRERGRNPRPRRLDLQIAATAAQHSLVLLTRNGDDFAGLESAVAVVDLGIE